MMTFGKIYCDWCGRELPWIVKPIFDGTPATITSKGKTVEYHYHNSHPSDCLDNELVVLIERDKNIHVPKTKY
jgi:hypothetical protein